MRQEDLGQSGSPPEPQFLPSSNGDNKSCPDYVQSNKVTYVNSGCKYVIYIKALENWEMP